MNFLLSKEVIKVRHTVTLHVYTYIHINEIIMCALQFMTTMDF